MQKTLHFLIPSSLHPVLRGCDEFVALSDKILKLDQSFLQFKEDQNQSLPASYNSVRHKFKQHLRDVERIPEKVSHQLEFFNLYGSSQAVATRAPFAFLVAVEQNSKRELFNAYLCTEQFIQTVACERGLPSALKKEAKELLLLLQTPQSADKTKPKAKPHSCTLH